MLFCFRSSQEHNLLHSLRQEYEIQKRERLRLERCAIQIDLSADLEKKRFFEEELRRLREEESCLMKQREEEIKREHDEEERIKRNKEIVEEWELQKK